MPVSKTVRTRFDPSRSRHPDPSRKDDPILPDAIEEALAVGRAARELTESQAYLTVMQSLEAYHVAAMIAAPEGPSGSDTRDHHHRLLYALREIAGDLAARTLAAAEIEKTLAEEAEDEEDDI